MSRFFRVLLGLENGLKANPLPISTPDITKGQIFAGLQFAVSTAVGAAVLTPAEGQVLIGASGLIGAGIAIGDAIMRSGRAKAIAAKLMSAPGGGGHMGINAPQGDPLPPLPPTAEKPLSSALQPRAEEPPSGAFDRVEAARTAPPPPPPPAPPSVPDAHVVEAQRAVEAAEAAAVSARQRLAALQNVVGPTPPQQ